MISGTIRGMLESGNFIESQNNRVTLQEISGMVLEKVCEYLCYNLKYKDQADVADFDISPEMSLELLMAADYLDGKLYPILHETTLTALQFDSCTIFKSYPLDNMCSMYLFNLPVGG